MKIGVIDIGSNSVRLMLWADGNTLYKRIKTTRLGDGLNYEPRLKAEACKRTAEAVSDFYCEALKDGAEKVYAFATAAVRTAENPEDFTALVNKMCGVNVDVVSGNTEANLAIAGALGNVDGGIIDVGGASTEVSVRAGGKTVYAKSVNIGTVRILDAAGRDLNKINAFITRKIADYGEFDASGVKMYAVGGTASRLGAIKRGIKVYNSQAIDGTELSVQEVLSYAKLLTDMPIEQIREQTICGNSADVIGGGAALLAAIMDKFAVKKITVSERDNLEGYLNLKLTEYGGGADV